MYSNVVGLTTTTAATVLIVIVAFASANKREGKEVECDLRLDPPQADRLAGRQDFANGGDHAIVQYTCLRRRQLGPGFPVSSCEVY